MTILRTDAEQKSTGCERDFRIYPVTTKLTREERDAVTRLAASQNVARGHWIRDAILSKLRSTPENGPTLAEVLGVRLLLVNVLRPLAAGRNVPPETFDQLLDEISTAKHELADRILSERRG